MIRRAFTMRLKPDSLAEYKHHHDNIWPELVAEIERSGIASITTFQRDLDLFLVSEIADEAAWDKLWNSEVHRRWAELMQPLMHLRDDGIVDAGELAEVFHIRISSNGPVSAAEEIAAAADDLIAEALSEVEEALEHNPAAAEEPASETPQQPAGKPSGRMARRKSKKSAAKKTAGKKKTPAKKVHRKQATKSRRPKAAKKAAKKTTRKKSVAKKAAKARRKKSAKKKR
ncbi:MAG TPA: L-rhamnose mutarotase [Pirellulales bacterium]|jgi:L-rhamnose mutarotase|nr:L-rhamnose mutarotase [Pirellulales bacterium]